MTSAVYVKGWGIIIFSTLHVHESVLTNVDEEQNDDD